MIDLKKGRSVFPIAEYWLDTVKMFFADPSRPWIERKDRRVYFSSYQNKLKFRCLEKVSEYTKNDPGLRQKCVDLLKYWRQHFDDIILATPATMAKQIEKWENKERWQSDFLFVLNPVLVSFYEIISKKFGKDLVEKLNIKTCPYCNRQFIHTFKGNAPERPELDHFYPKSKYPLYCLSFYNLIPICHSCNHVKSNNLIGVNPYQRAFNRRFVITDNDGNKLTKSEIYNLSERDIRLDFDGYNSAEENNKKVLGLDDVYNKHKGYVKELIDKSMAYDKHAREVLVDSFQGAGYHPRQVYDFVWGRHLMDAQYEDRPLSKLTKDILDLLDIN